MEAIDSINARIMQIQSRIATLTAPAVGAPAGTTSAGATAFDGAMRTAVAQQSVAVTTRSPGRTTSTEPGSGADLVDAKGVPLDLVRYGNGQIPASELSTISGTHHRLWAPAAASFEAMRGAAAKAGVTIGITDSYRTLASQEDLVRRKGLYSAGGLAAKPGTSNHGWGTAMDLRLDPAAQRWIRAHGKEYGFVEDVPREPWHWHYVPTH